jgi:hypothetical protein
MAIFNSYVQLPNGIFSANPAVLPSFMFKVCTSPTVPCCVAMLSALQKVNIFGGVEWN